jgi:hypothetical protein
MSNQLDLNLCGPSEIKVFGADGYGEIHFDITHCHNCWPGPQVTAITRDSDLPGYRFECRKCKAKWNQTDNFISEYNEAVKKYPSLVDPPLDERSQDG